MITKKNSRTSLNSLSVVGLKLQSTNNFNASIVTQKKQLSTDQEIADLYKKQITTP